MQNKLLPCPFCGGEAEIDIILGVDERWLVRCPRCFCKTTTFANKKSALITWNTRKPMERIVEQLEEEAYETEVWDERYTDKYYKGVSDGCKVAIEIVKGGVENEID